MGVYASDWMKDQWINWPPKPPNNKIDTHHHYVPDFYRKAVEDAGGDPSGWHTPSWSPLSSQLMMERLGIRTAILSVTAPGACIFDSQKSFDLARKLNVFASDLRDQYPSQYGFFASLPSLLHTQEALKELRYALDVLHADGVTLFTRYGSAHTYLGHPSIEPIWEELNKRKCIVFVHPTHPVDTTCVNPIMLQPMIDYTHETSRAAMDMIIMGTRSKYPDCKVILSHAGGALPYLISRITTPMRMAPDFAVSFKLGTTHAKAMADFRSFYYDLALSTSPQVIRTLLELVPSNHILYGSDFPYAPTPAYSGFLKDLEEYPLPPEMRERINYANAIDLIPRLAQVHPSKPDEI